jgi:hypothetical protein
VRSLRGERDPRVFELLRAADADRRRYLDVLRLACRILPSPQIEREIRAWDVAFPAEAP